MAAAKNSNEQPPPPEFIEEMKRLRRRQRWSAFLTPLITLASIVISIGLLMFFMRSCSERLPVTGGSPQGGAGSLPRAFSAAPLSQSLWTRHELFLLNAGFGSLRIIDVRNVAFPSAYCAGRHCLRLRHPWRWRRIPAIPKLLFD